MAGLKYRKRIKLPFGFYLNVGSKGITSLSHKLGPVTTNSKSGKSTVNLPGGFRYETDGYKKSPTSTGEYSTATIRLPKEDMELLKSKTGNNTNKGAVETAIAEMLEVWKES